MNISRRNIRLARRSMAAAIALAGTTVAGLSQAQGALEEVLITAQKREQSLQEVPISVATMSGGRMEAIFSDGSDILALGTRIPGLYAESSNGRISPRFYIRGLGNVDFDLAASQPVSIVMDDVVMEAVTLKSFPLFDVSQIEVVRGPQGTLFGRNTIAGIVKFDTRRPTEEREAFFKVTAGSLGTRNFEGAISGAIAENTLSHRFSLLSQNRDDWIDNAFTGKNDAMGGFEELAYRGQLMWTPSDDFTALFSHQNRDLDGTSSIFRANVFTTGKNGLNSNYDRDKVYFDDGNNNPQEIEASGTTLKLEWAMKDITVTSISSYQEAESRSLGDIDGAAALEDGSAIPGPILFSAVTEDQADAEQLTQEIRFASEYDGRWNWQAGGYYFDSELAVTTIDGFFGATTVVHENTTWALFAQSSYELAEDLTITGGIRYTDDEKDLTVGAQNVDGFALVIGEAAVQDYDPVGVNDDQISWELSANYAVDDNSSLFVRMANGFRAQSIQARDLAFEGLPSIADSETISSFEAGYKADLLDGRARLNVGVFYYRIDDIQLSAIGGANNGNSLLNADEGEGRGFEIDLEYAPTDNLRITAGYGYADTELRDADLATAPCGSRFTGAGCTVTDPLDSNGLALIDGNPFQAAPDSTLSLTARYTIPLDSGELYIYTDWAYQGETNLALYESVELNTDDQFEGGLRVGYVNHEHDYEVALFGRNITDEDNIKGQIDFNNNTGFVNDPNMWGVDFRMDF